MVKPTNTQCTNIELTGVFILRSPEIAGTKHFAILVETRPSFKRREMKSSKQNGNAYFYFFFVYQFILCLLIFRAVEF